MREKLKVKKSDIQGEGVFATDDIKAGELICVMDGKTVTIKELKELYKGNVKSNSVRGYSENLGCDPLQVSERLYVDMHKPYVLINHSCEPNAYMSGRNSLYALRDINRDEEITYNYAFTEWTSDQFWTKYAEWEMPCGCGTKSCRMIISEFRYLPKKIQREAIAAGHVQDFIKRKFARAALKSS